MLFFTFSEIFIFDVFRAFFPFFSTSPIYRNRSGYVHCGGLHGVVFLLPRPHCHRQWHLHLWSWTRYFHTPAAIAESDR